MNNYQPNYINQPFNNPYIYSNMQPQMPRMQPIETQYIQPQNLYKQPMGLQGKSVDSIDVVKAMDIPLDGTISYFPLTDGSAIVTKQLQKDGSSKTIIYKPINLNFDSINNNKYVTESEWNENIPNIKEELKDIKEKLKNVIDETKSLSNINKERKK